ncbi:nucleotide disphospho-sugar-binding domain-containing protein [Streptomyces tendae]|uniref:nucleotide disphospho-sugar-binding domain-containing protein n=1 Tax=Streptomyces tendae TaxID=1932 RepID=UPI003711FAA8
MRILFSGTPAYGHLLPLLPLERVAREAGHDTAVLTHGSMADVVAPARVLAAGASLEEILLEVQRRTGANATEDTSAATVGEFFGGARVDLGLDEALAAAREFGPELIVSDYVDYLGPAVAAGLGVPWASHAVGIAVHASQREAMRTAATDRMRERDITPTDPVASVDPWPECLQPDDWTAAPDRIALRSTAYESETETETGSWSRPEFPGRDHLPRVLVTLGTIVDDADTLAAIVDSLGAHDVNAIVAVNPAADASGLSVDTSRVHLTGFVPMNLLLDGVDVVVSSGGAGTVLAALSSGTPMVLLPMGLDKPVNAERAAHIGAAVVVTEPGAIGEAVGRVLTDPSYAEAAATASKQIAGTHTPEEVLDLLLARTRSGKGGPHMRAIRQYAHGPADMLRLERVDRPEPGPDEVLIKVEAAGVHLMDTVLRAGSDLGLPLLELPMTPGREAAGTVEAVGAGVDPSWLGRRVVAYLGHERSGGYAEFAAADAAALHALPISLTAEAAVAMIGTGRTVVGVLDQAELTDRDTVVITAAAGGMGILLVQAARRAGATVIGLAGGPRKVEHVLAEGADAAVDYTADGWEARLADAVGPDGASAVFDGVGGPAGVTAMRGLAIGGRHMYYGWASKPGSFASLPAEELAERGISSRFVAGPTLFALPGGIRALESRALEEATTGRLRPALTTYALSDAAQAHRDLESRATTGKVVLLPG